MDYDKLYDKLSSNIHQYNDRKYNLTRLNVTVMNFVKRKNLIIYGGTAVDRIIIEESSGEDKLYDDSATSDIDVLSSNFEEDANELVAELKKLNKNDLSHIKVVTGITGKTRKIFVNIFSSALIDITYLDPKYMSELKPLKIKGFLYAGPQFLKIHQYQNLICQLYNDSYRIPKAIKKIKILEKWYPLTVTRNPAIINIDYTSDDILPSLKDVYLKYECILGGDYVYYIYYESESTTEKEVVLYSNNTIDKEIPKEGVLRSPNYRILPLMSEMFYNVYDDDIIYRICTKACLLHLYYYLLFYANIDNSDKIDKLLNDPETMNIYSPDYDEDIYPQIYSAKYNVTKNFIKSIPTQFVTIKK
jgi:hypothetical protein